MQWIDEMFAGMEKDRAAELVKRSAKGLHVHRTEHLKEENPDTVDLWSALTSAIAEDVNEFNHHKERTGQGAVRISNRQHQCEVYLPGMQGKRMVLTLEDNELRLFGDYAPKKWPLRGSRSQKSRKSEAGICTRVRRVFSCERCLTP